MRRVMVLLLALLSIGGVPLLAAQPQTINYQGYLTTPAGAPVSATVSMVFQLWDAASGGTALWTETQDTVSVSNGVFSVVLGSVSAIRLPFDVPYYLGVTVGADAEMTPRQPLAASPYAFRAQAVSGKKIAWYSPMGNSSTVDTLGFGNVITGTATVRNVSTTNLFASTRRLGFATSATAGSSAGTRHGALQFSRRVAPGIGGFLYVARFGISSATTVATQRSFVGLLGSAAAIGNVDPSTLTDVLGFGVDSSDNQWFFLHNDNTGVATKIPLTGVFPARSLSTDLFEVRIHWPLTGSPVFYSMQRLDGGYFAAGSVNSDIPGNTTLLSPQIWTNNGTTAAAAAIDVASQYLETDY